MTIPEEEIILNEIITKIKNDTANRNEMICLLKSMAAYENTEFDGWENWLLMEECLKNI